MKRLFPLACLVVLFLFSTSFLLAQTAATPDSASGKTAKANLYVKTLYISRVYPHTHGYKINYWTNAGSQDTLYVPLSWFGTTGGKGELISEYNQSVPYMEVVFDEGKFKVIRLHLVPSYNHISWGVLTDNIDISDKFKVDALNIQY